jgi:hypothetical protein
MAKPESMKHSLMLGMLYSLLLVGITIALVFTCYVGLRVAGQAFTPEWVAAVSPLAVASGFVVWTLHRHREAKAAIGLE